MAAKKYTTCIEPEHYVLDLGTHLLGFASIALLALTIGFVAYAIIAIAGGPIAITAAVAVLTLWISIYLWYLHGRLICLGPDNRTCAIIGVVRSHGQSDPSWGEKYGDDDYTMNLWLAPGPINDDAPEQEYWQAPQGHLIAENQKILNLNKHYPDRKYLKYLHCEFEGSGIHDRLMALYGIVATLLLSLVVPGFWIVSIILGLLLVFGKGIFGTKGQEGSGTPLDVGVRPGSLEGGAVVVVTGSWIYDSGHGGWNEIHPVMACQVIGYLPAEGWAGFSYTDPQTQQVFPTATPDDVLRLSEFWCGVLKGATKAEDEGNRNDPSHAWVIHPLIDGCTPPPIIL
jgi:hypothetical protein